MTASHFINSTAYIVAVIASGIIAAPRRAARQVRRELQARRRYTGRGYKYQIFRRF